MAASSSRRHPPLWIIAVLVGVLVFLLPHFLSDYMLIQQVQLALILALVVGGLNLSLGFAGELALGQPAMYAAGAYSAGLLATHGHTNIVLELVVASASAVVVGIVTGIPGLRLNSWSLAMTSFFLVLLLPDILSIFENETGGYNGLSGIMPATFFGHALSPDDLYKVIVLVAVLWFAVMRNLVVSRHGTALRVLKQSPVLASSMGISVFRMKLLAYALGALPAGLAGALLANLTLYISPKSFDFSFAIIVLAASVLGGSATVYGAIIGAFILQFGLHAASDFRQYSLLATGAFLIIGGVLLTGGLIGLARYLWGRWGVRPAAEQSVPGGAAPRMPALRGTRLEVRGVVKSFGGNRALDGVDLVAEPGRVTALIGPNGSGKTTLLNMICGFYRTDAGSISLGGKDLHGRAPYSVARAGVARTFQTPNIPVGITVLEAVAAGRYSTRHTTVLEAILRLPRHRRVSREDAEEARLMLELVGIRHLEHSQADALPLGQRRLLEVARSLVGRPGVLLLDEVASGLDEDEIGQLVDVIGRVRDAGGTVVLVEHNFQLVLSVADEIFALAHGQLMARGTPKEIENDSRVMSEYLGIDQDQVASVMTSDGRGETGRATAAAGTPPGATESLLAVRGLCTGYGDLRVVWDVSLDVRPGEITVLLGRNGAGKTTTIRAIAGLNRVHAGEVLFDGASIKRTPAHALVDGGMAYVQEGKRIFRGQSVEQNLLLGGYSRTKRRRELRAEVERIYELFPILGERRRLAAASLSGGQQQMLAIGQALMAEPKLLLLDEPSGGLAPVIVREVMERIDALKQTGLAILLVEQAVEASFEIADQVVVIDNGRSTLSAPAGEISDITVIQDAYFGKVAAVE